MHHASLGLGLGLGFRVAHKTAKDSRKLQASCPFQPVDMGGLLVTPQSEVTVRIPSASLPRAPRSVDGRGETGDRDRGATARMLPK